MQVTFETGDPAKAAADALVVPVGSGAMHPRGRHWQTSWTRRSLVSYRASPPTRASAARMRARWSFPRWDGYRVVASFWPVSAQAESIGEATVTRMAGAAVRAGRDAGARHIAVRASRCWGRH